MASGKDNYDAILIPGGGVRANFELPIWTKRRLQRAIEINSCRYFIALSAGTTHKPPPLDSRGVPIFESVAAVKYLRQNGIPANKILYETASYDTIGNAYFAKVIHIDPLNLAKLLVITSEFHMPRTEAIFSWIYSSRFSRTEYYLDFESVSDSGIEKTIIEERKNREKSSLASFHKINKAIANLAQLHGWLFNSHKTYSYMDDQDELSGNVLNTY